jgi:hypothetical protein
MNLTEYGPFASIIAIAAALAAVFALVLVKAVGRVSQWTWLIHDTPPFTVTAGARALAIAFIGASFVLIDKSNYKWFAGGAVLSGILSFILIARFDRLRKTNLCKVPILANNGTHAIDQQGKPRFEMLVIGGEGDMNAAARAALTKARQAKGGISLCNFMGGYGASKMNDPSAIWDMETLATISNRMTIALMGIILSGVMALYLAASTIEVYQRPVSTSQSKP